MLSLIGNAEVFTPEEQGRQSILVSAGKIVQVSPVDRRAAEALRIDLRVIKASIGMLRSDLSVPLHTFSAAAAS